MNTATRVQILDETDCISHSTNTLGKGMNPIILPPAMGKQQDRLGSSALVRQLVQEKENSEFKPVKLRLKIDLVSYPVRAEGLVNRIRIFLMRWAFLSGYLMELLGFGNGLSRWLLQSTVSDTSAERISNDHVTLFHYKQTNADFWETVRTVDLPCTCDSVLKGQNSVVHSAGAVEYTDCISAQG